MSTLPNVDTRRGEAKPPSVRVAPDTIPEARSSKTGVSVKYIQSPDKKWFVFRASYGREEKAAEILLSKGEYTYYPKHYVRKSVNGKMKRVLEPLIPNLLFCYITEKNAGKYVRSTPSLSFLSFYYNHFETEKGKNPPLTISSSEMLNFIKASSVNSEHIMMIDPAQSHFSEGDYVSITGGAFAGVKGHVARIAGQQRVVVTLKGICSIATAYIPTALLRIAEEAKKTEALFL